MLNWFNELSAKNKAVAVGFLLLTLWVLHKKYYWRIKLFFAQKTDFDDSDYVSLNESKKDYIRSLGPRVKEMTSGWWYSFIPYSIDMKPLEEVAQLNDVELKFFAEYYNGSLGGNIVSEIDWLSAYSYDSDDILINRLNSLGYA